MSKPKRTRGDAQVGEHLNSPVTDPGYWPYPKLPGGLQEKAAGLNTPPDPFGLVPDIGGDKSGEDDFE